MSIKKTLQEKRAKVELTDEIVRKCLWNTDTYDEYKNIADDGGMEGVKDAAHLEKIINKVAADLEEIINKHRRAAADLIEACWKEIINKHRNEDILSPKNGNDLPNVKPASKKKRKGKGNGKKKKFEEVKGPMKKKDALDHRLPGHYGANQ